MSKKKGEGLKSFNKGFSVPDTYIILCSEGLLRDTGCHVHDERGGEDPYGN